MKVDQLVPEIYYKESRDFAFVGRTLELICNYMKTAADCVNVNTDNIYVNPDVVQLVVNSLGFIPRHEYNIKDLVYVASAFTDLLKNKGSKYAIKKAVQLLLNSQHIPYSTSPDFDLITINSDYELEVKVPSDLKDLILLEDLFDYILPAGMVYKFIKVDVRRDPLNISKINVKETATINEQPDNVLGQINIGQFKNDNSGNPNKGYGTIYSGVVVSNNNNKTTTKEGENKG